ncbi:Uma2 family endonuclease [Streptomyces sp. JJ66]|uniref:Uma2 family endonuclease n=1 Tax=Streptomyces sp. JJ66 TaxID=2803843 RepID=UPI001C586567|nr:Uma2 family endonuclease [Streptomyces sp. JJ66]MBW1602417.1 Uma2 family endonuclease [Streptomyces sp. JJ66]
MTLLNVLRTNPAAALPTEGYVVDVIAGRVVMTPNTPDQDRTLFAVRGQLHERLGPEADTISHVLVDFTQDTALAPDLAVLAPGATPHGHTYSCVDLRAVVEYASVRQDVFDFGTKPAVYARFGVSACLIIDPYAASCVLLENPGPTGYGARGETPFGEPVWLRLGDGQAVELDTSAFPTAP